MQWFHSQFPNLADDIHHFANERKCTGWYGKHLQAMGVKKGVADIFLAIPHNGYSGLWIELKVLKGKLSAAQKEFLSRKSTRGYLAVSAWGWEAAKEITLDYLKNYNTSCYSENLFNGKPIC
jgi:hypothetical protein